MSVVELASTTREQAAFQQFERAVDRVRRLEHETTGCFTELHKAIERMAEIGVPVTVEMTDPVSAAWRLHGQ